MPGFALEDCVEQIGSEIERTVSWQSEAALSSLQGKPIRLRFVMKDVNLYAMRSTSSP